MDSLPEVIVVSDSENKNANFSIFDLKNGSLLGAYTEGNSVRHGLAFIGEDYVISALKNLPLMKVWTFSKKHEEQCKMPSPGVVSCLAVTNCGSYCIAGIDKSIYVWEVVSGALLTSIQYHSKTVSCVRISSDGSHFISGSGDGMVLVWLLAEAVAATESSDNVKPRFTWMDHSAEVTDIFIGGISVYARVATASKDMTCRLYELETGFLLFTVRVDYAITAVIMDELEYFLILGSAEGHIYRINLFSAEDPELHYSKVDAEFAFLGHSKEITCLSMSLSGKYLVSGSEDQSCRVWDMTNFSCVRRIPCSGAVTNAFVTLLPPGLKNEAQFCPKMNIATFKRQYDKNDNDAVVVARIQPKKLSLFHLGSPDEYFDSRILLNSEKSGDVLCKSTVSVKDVTTINTQMYSYALCDTFLEVSVHSDTTAEDGLLSD